MHSWFYLATYSLILAISWVATPQFPPVCPSASTLDEPWGVGISISGTDSHGCLLPLGLENAMTTLQSADSPIPVLESSGTEENVSVTISFTGAPYSPHIVEVSGLSGVDRANYQAITTCLSDETFRMDGKPRNDTCAVKQSTDGEMWITFTLPPTLTSMTEVTLFLQVRWYEPITNGNTSPHHINQWAITLLQN